MRSVVVTVLFLCALAGCGRQTSTTALVRFEGRQASSVVTAAPAALAVIVDPCFVPGGGEAMLDADASRAAASWSYGAFGERSVAMSIAEPEQETVLVHAVHRDRWRSPLAPGYQNARSTMSAWLAALEHVLGARAEIVDGPGAAPEAPDRAAPARYRVMRAAPAPVIDGRLDDAAWAAAAWTEPFIDIEGPAKPSPRHRTRAKILWDDENLYVAARLDEPHVWGTLTAHDSIIYHDNDFEVFVDPDGDGNWYAEVEVNALGTIFDLRLDRPYHLGGSPDIAWSPEGLRAAVAVEGTLNDPSDRDRAWTVEIAIPHAGLVEHATVPVPPRAGDVWRLNMSRVQWTHDVVDGTYVKREGLREDNWVWTPQFIIDMHRPERWGFVEFVGGE